jgi:hypothetical protein
MLKHHINLETLAKLERVGFPFCKVQGPSHHLKIMGKRLVYLNKKRLSQIYHGVDSRYLDDEIAAIMWMLACIQLVTKKDVRGRLRDMPEAKYIDLLVFDDALDKILRHSHIRQEAAHESDKHESGEQDLEPVAA